MDVQDPLRHLAVPCLAHRTMFAGLVAGDGVVVGYPVALLPQRRVVVAAELAAVGGIGGEDVVVGLDEDCCFVVFFMII